MASKKRQAGRVGAAPSGPSPSDTPRSHASARSTGWGRAAIRENPSVRFVLRAGACMAVLYTLYYFPYSDSWPARALSALLSAQAHAAAWLIARFDSSVSASHALIQGRFPMQVVKACSSLDAQALFLATVLAFPSKLGWKVAGAALGVTLLTGLNVMRIASLYFVGAYAPRWFDMVHEELFPLLLVLAACAAFGAWALWARRAVSVGRHA